MSEGVLSLVQVTFEQWSLASSVFNYIVQYFSTAVDQFCQKMGDLPENLLRRRWGLCVSIAAGDENRVSDYFVLCQSHIPFLLRSPSSPSAALQPDALLKAVLQKGSRFNWDFLQLVTGSQADILGLLSRAVSDFALA